MSTPAELRAMARDKRQAGQQMLANAEYAEGQTYRDEMRQGQALIEEARDLEREAAELEAVQKKRRPREHHA